MAVIPAGVPKVVSARRALRGLGIRPPWRRHAAVRAGRVLDRRTYALGGLALATAGAVIAGEIARVWSRGEAPLPAETDDVLGAAEEALRESFEVAVEGYRRSSTRENALFNMLVSFVVTFGFIRTTTHVIHTRGQFGPFRNVTLGKRHIHHFVPGIALAFAAGGTALVTRDEEVEKWLAIPFGAGAALTFDESALLLELEDVYWTERGLVSVQITLAAIALLSAFALSLRLLRRGEERVLEGWETMPPSASSDAAPQVTAGDGSR